eukprot:scaffold109273_cov18-Tisochrysis_lutea.AAC.2
MDGGAVTQIRVNAAPICLKRGLMQKLVDGSAVTQIMFIAALIVVARDAETFSVAAHPLMPAQASLKC